jgi:hypothetical protein
MTRQFGLSSVKFHQIAVISVDRRSRKKCQAAAPMRWHSVFV